VATTFADGADKSAVPHRASLSDPACLAYLGLGSNLGDRAERLRAARATIAAIPGCSVKAASSLYSSAAWGSDTPQPDYLNAVIAVATSLAPLSLLQETGRIEQSLGRIRSSVRNASRTVDIDLLLCGDAIMDTAKLVLPHPRMHLRAFVLLPLLEIAPDIVVPGRGSASRLLSHLPAYDVTKVSENSAWN
jgi:2-amino-4-hydroxy-6-hydroxymethyldihydropteridine diphosphokinase